MEVIPIALAILSSLSWPSRHRLLIIIAISLLVSYCEGECQSFRCGNYTLDYPFGRKNSGCGDPGLQVECDYEEETPLLNLGGRQYYILEPQNNFHMKSMEWYQNRTMKILAKRLVVDQCDLSESIYLQFLKGAQFHIADGYSNLTLGKACVLSNVSELYTMSCNGYRYYNFMSLDSSITCESIFEVPVTNQAIDILGTEPMDQILQGLKITWSARKYCEDCESGLKNCDNRKTLSFCYCRGISYSDKCGDRKSRIAVILGAAIGASLLFTIAILLVVIYAKKTPFPMKIHIRLAVTKVEKFLQEYIHQMPTRYSYSDLKKITDNFSDVLGKGGFGEVYKGKLPGDKLVAVKILDQSKQSETQFMNEVATLGTIHHVHLVRLMGYCFEKTNSALVYEYMENGSLEKFIFPGRENAQILNWEQLYSIAIGAARGIAYLHNECRRRIIHFDIKPHNILLDGGLTARVADFGLAKLCGREDDHVTLTAAKGTPGYIAPEVWSRELGPVTDKSDVYSFGMVLLEMVGGRKNIELVSRSSQVYFPDLAFKLLENGQIEMMLRTRPGNTEMDLEDEAKAKRMTKVGLWCIQYSSTDRPSMNRVVQMLEGNGDDVENPPKPFNSSSAPQTGSPSLTDESSSLV